MAQKTRQETDKVDIFMPIYIGDYLKDTNRLSTEQHGAYLLLLFDYWQHGHLPDDDAVLCRIARMTPDAWSNACSILKAYFKKEDGRLVHSRVERELQKAKAQKKRFQARATKGAEARWSKDSDATSNQQAMLKQCPSPSPSPKDIDSGSSTSEKSKAAKEACAEFLSRFNTVLCRSFKTIGAKAERQLSARMKEGYTIDQIINAAIFCSRTEYHQKNKQYLTPEFITREDKLLVYLQEKKQSEKQLFIGTNNNWKGQEVNADGLTWQEFMKATGQKTPLELKLEREAAEHERT